MQKSLSAFSRSLRLSILIASFLKSIAVMLFQKRKYHFDALFLIHDYRGSKFSRSIVETDGLRVPTRYITDFPVFNVRSSSKNCPSGICASAANTVCEAMDM
jgi:hypothetical protein